MTASPKPSLKLLFVADPLEAWNIKKDSTFAMMREAQARGHALAVCEPKDLMWRSDGPHPGQVVAYVRDVRLTGATYVEHTEQGKPWFVAQQQYPNERPAPLTDFDAVLMRKDPPFDAEYIYATHLLEKAEAQGAKVFNRPAALRNHPEKLAILEFPQFITPTLVTRDASDIKRFHAEHRDIILKPLDGMGGAGIFRVKDDGLNLGAIIETLNRDGAQTVMVQRYLPAIAQGDKRVLVIGGEVVPYCLARIPQGGEVRGNLAAGGKGVAQPISPRDREIAEAIGPKLAARGLLLIGLDVIGESLTEINVTSPTCFQEITDQTGLNVAGLFMDALARAVHQA
jgi:glutathione synthase